LPKMKQACSNYEIFQTPNNDAALVSYQPDTRCRLKLQDNYICDASIFK
jgi:hypothetical protein